ncbi:hypothetical protein KGMB02408_33920 [Bacteroides faecalis]|uniref:Uncharacterized protein n=1 Tax=Bacteroides faecalis TaxID=2447885 RepID=A0A401LY88_9BACE|nr:hypothetical protein KGMB02408_33920 [Bacteroides faecalis]
MKLLPFPDSDFTEILPLCRVFICLHRLNPMPDPDVFVVKKGTNILPDIFGNIHSPLSDTVKVIVLVE